ncbi:MAG TPA: NAD(P)H-hydrate dehydratase [Bellilinea sp.]|nr:NAD(P)H-hydrate dehydratase [Bellilinea sp.]
MKLVSVAEMHAIEREANAAGVSYAVMMERAGNGIAGIVDTTYSHGSPGVVIGLIGSGNNGGDTLVALENLAKAGWRTRAVLVRPRSAEDPYLERVVKTKGEVLTVATSADWDKLETWLNSADVLLDGVLGTGVQLPLKFELAAWFEKLMDYRLPHHIVAVDCPSGVDCDTGEIASHVIPAELTICLDEVKQGLLRFPAHNYVGTLRVVDLGLPDNLAVLKTVRSFVVSGWQVKALLPARPKDAHKGTFGTALVVAGSVNFTGAAALAGEAAYRIGAGLVRLAVPSPLHAILSGLLPEVTWLLLPHEMGVIAENAADLIFDNLERVSALLIGPGLGQEHTTGQLIRRLMSSSSPEARHEGLGFLSNQAGKRPRPLALPPMVIDADGLKLLSVIKDWPQLLPKDTILTPHPGEMSVLTGLEIGDIQADRLAIARRYALEWGQVVVLKGAMTVVADPGGQVYVIPVATAALARAGTGDVLAGLIVGLRAQGVTALDAAIAGAWIHAQAGLSAIDLVGHPASVLAGDVLASVPEVLREMTG